MRECIAPFQWMHAERWQTDATVTKKLWASVHSLKPGGVKWKHIGGEGSVATIREKNDYFHQQHNDIMLSRWDLVQKVKKKMYKQVFIITSPQ